MTDNLNDESELKVPAIDQLTTLKQRADMIGLAYHPSIGVDKLREKIAEHLASDGKTAVEVPAVTKINAEPVGEPTAGQKRAAKRREASALVRIRVTCMNPDKKEYEGEVITTGNAVVGTHRKFVPFNNEEGWHVPHIIYQVLKDRQCQIFVTKKGGVREGKLIKEFAIEVLPPLTKDELQDLAQRQAMSNSVG